MKPVKKHLSRFWFKLAGFFGSLFSLFITGCSRPMDIAMMYMSARAPLEISGIVQDDQSKALIEGIRVKLLNSQDTNLDTDISTTNTNNGFSLSYGDPQAGSYQVIAEDIDGTTNGAYSNATVNFTKDDGYFYTNITISLHKTN